MSRNKQSKRSKLSDEGFPGRIRYFFARAVANIRQNIFVNILTVCTITFALLLISLFLLVYINLAGLSDEWSKRVQVTVYYEQELAPQQLGAIKTKIKSLPGTADVTYVGKEEAERRFRSRLKGQESLLDGLTTDVLPASLEIALNREYRDTASVDAYVAKLKKIPDVGEVQYGEEWVRRYNAFLNFMRLVGALLGGFLLLAVLFIVSNTIKLTIYARRDELELLELVGATRMFIKAPFLIEGIFQGAAGAALSLALLTACYFTFLNNAGNFLGFSTSDVGLKFLSGEMMAYVFLGGVSLGFTGSLISLKRFTRS
jgi:cell division transport system permease protein